MHDKDIFKSMLQEYLFNIFIKINLSIVKLHISFQGPCETLIRPYSTWAFVKQANSNMKPQTCVQSNFFFLIRSKPADRKSHQSGEFLFYL